VVTTPSYAARAAAIKSELARHDAAREAAQLLERLAQTRQLVLRQ